ncbi:MAG: hypothetical protein ACRDTU_21095 [Micromonosporaceae bacterium]
MLPSTEWLIGAAVFVAGALLAGIAMFGIGLTLLWWGFDPKDGGRPWWMWLLFLAPPVLMLGAGLLVRRTGGSGPMALGGAGLVGALVGVGYLITAWWSGQ